MVSVSAGSAFSLAFNAWMSSGSRVLSITTVNRQGGARLPQSLVNAADLVRNLGQGRPELDPLRRGRRLPQMLMQERLVLLERTAAVFKALELELPLQLSHRERLDELALALD